MIQMSKNQYSTLLYWANVGYGAKGKLYEEQFPQRKSPWHKINKDVLSCTVAEELSQYILELQAAHIKLLNTPASEVKDTDIQSVRNCSRLVNILLTGYDVVKGASNG